MRIGKASIRVYWESTPSEGTDKSEQLGLVAGSVRAVALLKRACLAFMSRVFRRFCNRDRVMASPGPNGGPASDISTPFKEKL